MSRLVLGFDSWVGGVHNFQRLQPALEALGFDFRLLHIGSWGGDPGRPTEERFGKLLVRDISYYAGKGLYEVLEIENPCAVLFLSNDVFAHRAVNRYCGLLGVATLHIYHGLVGVQAIEATYTYKVNPMRQLYYVLERIPKALRHIWPLYLASLYRTKAPIADWIRFASDCLNLAVGRYIPVAASDSKTRGCCIYTSADKAHAKGKYGYADKEIHIVGNPDLERFGLNGEKIAAQLDRSGQESSEVIYIDTGLIFTGLVFDGAQDFIAHLMSLRRDLELQNIALSIKLHPDHLKTRMPDDLVRMGIKVLANEEFVDVLSRSSAAIVEPSTAALIPALMGVPIFLASFGKLAGQQYGDTLLSYPRATVLTDTRLVGSFLAKSKLDDQCEVKAWIRENSGPMPASDMPARVAAVVQQIVNK